MAGAAGVPYRIVQFITKLRHRQSVANFRICWWTWIRVHCSKVIWNNYCKMNNTIPSSSSKELDTKSYIIHNSATYTNMSREVFQQKLLWSAWIYITILQPTLKTSLITSMFSNHNTLCTKILSSTFKLFQIYFFTNIWSWSII